MSSANRSSETDALDRFNQSPIFEDEDGVTHILNPNEVDTLQIGDKVLLFLRLDDLARLEKALGS